LQFFRELIHILDTKKSVKTERSDEIVNIYFDNASMNALQKGLDAVWLRQQVISNNIANNETPDFKSSEVVFEDLLNDVLERSYSTKKALNKAIERAQPVVSKKENTFNNANGNNVDLDKENIEFARAQLQYYYLVSSLTSQINRLKYAINGGN